MASGWVKLAKINSTIKGYHFYFKSSNFGEILKCVLEQGNKYIRNAIKVLSTKGETTGHVPETLAKILTPEMARRYCYWKLKLLDHQEMPLKEKYRVHIPCTYKVYVRMDQKSYLRKKIKGSK